MSIIDLDLLRLIAAVRRLPAFAVRLDGGRLDLSNPASLRLFAAARYCLARRLGDIDSTTSTLGYSNVLAVKPTNKWACDN